MNPRKFIAVASAFFYLACPQALGSITYQISPRDGTFAPWSLDGGSITTDGTIGDISPENFESWELRFTSPSGESKISSDDGGAFLIVSTFFNPFSPSTSPSLIATADQLIVNPAGGGVLELYFASQDIFSDDFTGNVVAFSTAISGSINFANGSGSGLLIDNTVDSSNPIGLFSIDPNVINPNPAQLGHPNRSTFDYPSGPLAIAFVASVPEPSSLLLFAVCSSCLLLHRRVFDATGRQL